MTNLVTTIFRFEAVRAIAARLRKWAGGSPSRGRLEPTPDQPAQDGVTWLIGRKVGLGGTLIVGIGLAPMVILYFSADHVAPARIVMLAYLFVPIFLLVSSGVSFWLVRHIRAS